MLRITQVGSSNGSETLKLEGRVARGTVSELRRVAEECLSRTRLRLDLLAVSFVDTEGASLLRELVDRNVEILRSSSFVAELLRGRDR